MKTTMELPDNLFRKVKATAALKGMKIKDFVTEALVEKLQSVDGSVPEKPWMRLAGRARANPELQIELKKIDQIVETEFSDIDEADWQ